MTELAQGENRPLPAPSAAVTVTCRAAVDVSALLLAAHGKVRTDRDLIFFNNPVGPGVSYLHGAGGPDRVTIDVTALPPDVTSVVVTASLDGSGPSTFGAVGGALATVAAGNESLTFEMTGLTTETALVCVEVYRRNDAWKVRAVGQGYASGLAGIATDYGIDVDDEPAPAPPPPIQAPPTQVRPTSAPPMPPPAAYTPPTTPPPATPVVPQYNPGAHAMQSELFAPAFAETTGAGIQKQGSKMAKVALNGEIMARSGSMVAYQGNMRFEALGSGGIGNMIRQKLSGEGVPLMKVSGQGDLFLANAASDVHLIDLDGSDGLTINGANVLAFETGLSYKIEMVRGAGALSSAGLFNCVFTGRGRIAITTEGTPVVLTVDQPTYADPQAAVAWSSSLRTGVQQNDSFNLGTLMGRSTGERFTLSFSGQGFVIVQPSEQPPGGFIGGTGGGQQSGVGGALGGLLGGR
ncbi:AIM24 family protein [Williamsia sp. CHRR-6]|uniref:AIM24 family protein n=1 Tax=Williamsia sp. CHRR-6 TaxID=2835871 RepID=UPI001BD98469|nr:AIM24 family protein [Williamsia sp. CHRR-6]MBT0565749.1 AIM24 family protein [Williamsia sp. CHRR-6]